MLFRKSFHHPTPHHHLQSSGMDANRKDFWLQSRLLEQWQEKILRFAAAKHKSIFCQA